MINKPCPFCGGAVDPEGWLCGTCGPEMICNGCKATATSLYNWNTRMDDEIRRQIIELLNETKKIHEKMLFLVEKL